MSEVLAGPPLSSQRPLFDKVSDLALYNSKGRPRILQHEDGARVATLNLTCQCGLAVGLGLPCEGMLAVARARGAVLSFQLFHSHWFSNKLIDFVAPAPTFTKNKKYQLDEDAVLSHSSAEAAPSHVPDSAKPPPVVVAEPVVRPAAPTLSITVDGDVADSSVTLAVVQVGAAKSSRARSRRFKGK